VPAIKRAFYCPENPVAKQIINLGTAPTGAGGDTPRSAFVKMQANFDELYAAGVAVGSLTPINADMNTYVTAGVYSFSLPAANGPGFSYGTLEVQPRAPNEVIQIARDIVSDAVAARRFLGGVWSPWVRGYTESIVNANGVATRLPDGTQICRGKFLMPAQALNTSSAGAVATLPALFYDSNYDLVYSGITVQGSGAQADIGNLMANGVYLSKATGTVSFFSYAYKYAVANPVQLSYIAIGRWLP
jgi:hypothetical protein